MKRLLRIVTALLVLAPVPAPAQEPTVQLETRGTSGSITTNGGAVTLTNTGGMASLLIQVTGTFDSTWELQCAADSAGTTFDADDEIPVTLVAASPTAADSVTNDAEGLYTANIAGCTSVRVITTAFASGTQTVTLQAITSGGGSGGGGGGGGGAVTNAGTFAVQVTQGGNTAAVNASSQLSVTCANCSGSGVSQLEDTAFVDGGATTPAGVQRQDTIASSTSTDGDVTILKSDNVGRLYTTGTGGTFPISGVAAQDAAVSGNPVLIAGKSSAAAPTDVTADNEVVAPWLLRSGALAIQTTFAGVLATTGNGASGTGVQRVTIADNSTGVLATVASVTNVVSIGTSVTPGVAAGNLGKAEDAVAGSADTGVAMLGHIQTTPASTAADGDYGALKLDLLGKQWIAGAYPEDIAHATADPLVAMGCIRRDTTPSSSAGTAADYANCNIDDNGRIYVNATIYSAAGAAQTLATDTTHDSAASATGPQIMGEATTAITSDTAVADGDATRFKTDTVGRQITVVGCARQDRVRGTATITDGSSTSVLAALGANIIAEIYEIEIANTSATDVSVDLRDGTGGSVLWTLMAPATSDTGGGNNRTFTVPLTFTANTAVAADPSAAASSVIISVMGCRVL